MTDEHADVTGPARPTTVGELRAFIAQDLAARKVAGFGAESLSGWIMLRTFRLGQYLWTASGPIASLLRPIWRLSDSIVIRILLTSETNPDVACGPGLVFSRSARRIMLPKGCVLGSRVTIGEGGQLGGTWPRPVVGDDVVLWNDANILRGAVIGRGAHIGPWAMVLKDIPAGARALGVPASVLPEGEDFDF